MPNARRVTIEAGNGPGLVAARKMLLEMDDLLMCAEIAEAQAEEALAEAKVQDHEDTTLGVVARCQAAKARYEQAAGEDKMTTLLAYEWAQAGVRAVNSYGSTLNKERCEAALRRRQRIAAALTKEGITQ